MCGLQFCFMLCFKHSTAAISLCEGILNKLNTLMPKIQPELMKIMNGWSPRIKYNDNIRKKLTLKLRNALKQNKIKVLSMNMEEEDFYGKQITYFIYKRTLDYYENMNIEFEIIPMKKTWWMYNVSDDITNSYENNMDSFRNHLVSINDEYIIPIGTTNESEITVLHERFEKIMLDVIDHMNFDNIIETINNKYQQNQSTIDDETQKIRNMI